MFTVIIAAHLFQKGARINEEIPCLPFFAFPSITQMEANSCKARYNHNNNNDNNNYEITTKQ